MEKQTIRSSNAGPEPERSARPAWWSDMHTSRWDRVKEALRRDWEQTKADFSKDAGQDLNQDVGDTLKQAVGSAPLPPPTLKTHPDDARDAAKRLEDQIKERGKAAQEVAAARTDVEVERVRAQGAVASEQQTAQEKVVAEQRKLAEIAARGARETQEKLAKQQERIAEVRTDAGEKIAEAQQKAGEKVAQVEQRLGEKVTEAQGWDRVEAAVRYGYGARLQYADAPGWGDAVEARLRQEWGQLKGAGAWDEMHPHVRRGWDAASRGTA